MTTDADDYQRLEVRLQEATDAIAGHRAEHKAGFKAHSKVHQDEQLAVNIALRNVDKERAIHNTAHEREHFEHEKVHTTEHTGIDTALSAVGRERDIHAQAHEREHEGHEREHQLDKLAITKVEQATDLRFASVNEFRAQLSDQSKTFATLAAMDVRAREVDRRLEEMGRVITDKYEANRQRIENLEKGDVQQAGKGVGQGNVVAWIIAGVGLFATVLGIVMLLSGVLSKQ